MRILRSEWMLEAIKWMRDDINFTRDDMEMRREQSEMMRGEAEIWEFRRGALELGKLVRCGFCCRKPKKAFQR